MEDFLSGYKNYIIGLAIIGMGMVLMNADYFTEGTQLIALGMGLMGLRNAMKKLE